MLEEVKSALRISNTAYDDEIQNLIDACKSDLETSGVAPSYFSEEDEEDYRALIKQAIITYCKAQFGYDNQDATRLNESYELLKQKLAIVYNTYVALEEE
jgi:uncharacterized phage protein (predicted DNA packaging)